VLIGLFELPQDTTATSDDIPLIDPDADNAGDVYNTLTLSCLICFLDRERMMYKYSLI